jgi:hypothetical protein
MSRRYHVGPPPHIIIFRRHGTILKVVIPFGKTAIFVDRGPLWDKYMGKEKND